MYPDRLLPCPFCGTRVRAGDIIDGKHDIPAPKGGWSVKVTFLSLSNGGEIINKDGGYNLYVSKCKNSFL
jgi:hypothetical protein